MVCQRLFRRIYALIKEYFPRYYIQGQGIRYLLLLLVVIYCGIVSQGIETKSIPGTIHTDIETGEKDENMMTLYFGLSQQGNCVNDNTHYYFVQSRNAINSGVTDPTNQLSTPVCYYDRFQSCIDPQHYVLCQHIFTSKTYQQSIENFALLFDISKIKNDYFPYIRVIVNLSILSIFLIAAHGVTQLRYNKFALSFVNEINGFLILFFIVHSIFHYQLIFAEDCMDIVKSGSTIIPKNDYCTELTKCGLTISSVLDLNSNVAISYFKVLGTFSIVWGTFITLHFFCFMVYFIHLREVYYTEELHRSILTRTGDDLLHHLEQAPKAFIDIYIANWNYVYCNDENQPHQDIETNNTTTTTTTTNNNNNNVSNPLHIPLSPHPQLDCSDAQVCSICLGSLAESPFASTADGSGTDTNATTNSGTVGSSIRSHFTQRFDSIGEYINHMLSRLFVPSLRSSNVRGEHTRLPMEANDMVIPSIATTTSTAGAVTQSTTTTNNTPLQQSQSRPSSSVHTIEHAEILPLHSISQTNITSSSKNNNSTTTERSRLHTTTSVFETISNTITHATSSSSSTQQTRVIQLKCKHLFHQSCILHWATAAGPNGVPGSRNTVCPVCRDPLNPNRNDDDTFNSNTLLLS